MKKFENGIAAVVSSAAIISKRDEKKLLNVVATYVENNPDTYLKTSKRVNHFEVTIALKINSLICDLTLSDDVVAEKLWDLLKVVENNEIENNITVDESAHAYGVIKILLKAMLQNRDIKSFMKNYHENDSVDFDVNELAKIATENYLERTYVEKDEQKIK